MLTMRIASRTRRVPSAAPSSPFRDRVRNGSAPPRHPHPRLAVAATLLLALLAPSAPVAAQSLAAGNVTNDSATLTLSRDGYVGDWYWGQVVGGTSSVAGCTGPVSGATAKVTGLTPGVDYRFGAFSDSLCTSGLGSPAEFTTLLRPPGNPPGETAVANLEVSDITATSAILSVVDFAGPWWYRGSQPGAACIEVPAGTTTAKLTGLRPASEYTYRVWTVPGCGDSAETGDATFTTDSEQAPDRHPTAAIGVDVPCEDGLCRATTGTPLRFLDVSTGTVRHRLWNFHGASTSRSSTVDHAFESPGFHDVSLTVSLDGKRESTASLKFLVEASRPAGTCQAAATTLCLRDSRYALSLGWWTADGRSGDANVVREGTNDSGLFRFFDEDNWEMLVKVLDGCALNDRHWVYAASATDLGYALRVRDTATGVLREYRNEPAMPSPAITDGDAFAACPDSAASSVAAARRFAPTPWLTARTALAAGGPAHAGPAGAASAATNETPATRDGGGCTETDTTLCLLNGRYEVSLAWSPGAADGTGAGEGGPARTIRPRTDDSGLFCFFDDDNWEVLVKVLDGCGYNGHHWVYAASATTLGMELTVRDTENGESKTYVKEAGTPAPAITDTGAFGGRCAANVSPRVQH